MLLSFSVAPNELTSSVLLTSNIPMTDKKRKQPIDEMDVLGFIEEYHQRYDLVPTTTFLAYQFDVVVQTIYNKLKLLEELGYIERIKKDTNFIDYRLCKKRILKGAKKRVS